jgi:integrating conjugative element protein (TIGR03749 family)
MRNKQIYLLFKITAALPLLLLASLSWAETRRVYDDKPLSIAVPVKKEVRIVFPQDVNIQIPTELQSKISHLVPDSQTLYWTAKESFAPVRLIATALDGGKVYVVDIAADAKNPVDDIRIEDPAVIAALHAEKNKPVSRLLPSSDANFEGQINSALYNSNDNAPDEKPLSDPAEAILMRFAAQTLYAPSRLIPADNRISVASMPSIAKTFPLIQSTQGERFTVEPVGAWTGFNRYVTAVLIVNQTAAFLQFDHTQVRGNFTHITAQHINIGPRGSLEDRTTVYLISDVPFAEAILEDRYGF